MILFELQLSRETGEHKCVKACHLLLGGKSKEENGKEAANPSVQIGL